MTFIKFRAVTKFGIEKVGVNDGIGAGEARLGNRAASYSPIKSNINHETS